MKYIKITYPDINNGDGMRATIWFSGCSHHCEGCHNKHTWDYNQGKDITPYLYNEISEIFNSEAYLKGITLSGGDPLSQSQNSLNELYNFISWFKTKFPDKDIWIFAGDTYEECMLVSEKKDIVKLCDYMVDGVFKIEERDLSLKYRGSKNQRILNIKEYK